MVALATSSMWTVGEIRSSGIDIVDIPCISHRGRDNAPAGDHYFSLWAVIACG